MNRPNHRRGRLEHQAPLLRLPALDGLRAVAVLLVVAYHARLGPFRRGDLGVDVFFVLSGFLITRTLLHELGLSGRINLRRFYVRRAGRLLPAYVVTVVICVAIDLMLGLGGGTYRGAALSFIYAANWGAAYGESLGLLHHTWSLSLEEQFYLGWPILFTGLLARRKIDRVAGLIACLLALASLTAAVVALSQGATWARAANGTDTRSSLLLAGCALALTLRSREAPLAGRGGRLLEACAALSLALLLAVSASSITGRLIFPLLLWPVVAATTSCVIVAAVWVPASRTVRILSCPAATWLGERSYALYLWHFPVFVVLDTEYGLEEAPIAVLGCLLAVSLAAASFTLVERPARRRLLAAYDARAEER